MISNSAIDGGAIANHAANDTGGTVPYHNDIGLAVRTVEAVLAEDDRMRGAGFLMG